MSQELEKQPEMKLDERAIDFLDGLTEFMEEEDVKDLKIDNSKIQDNSFKIETKEQANFFIRQVQDARAQIMEIEDTADNMLSRESAKINSWRERETNKIQNSINYMSGLLQNFTEETLAEGKGKKKSISLPNGTIGFKKQGDKYEYDDKIILEYLKDNEKEEYINYKPTVAHAELKKAGDAKDGKLYLDGQEVPGITVTPQDPKFEIK